METRGFRGSLLLRSHKILESSHMSFFTVINGALQTVTDNEEGKRR